MLCLHAIYWLYLLAHLPLFLLLFAYKLAKDQELQLSVDVQVFSELSYVFDHVDSLNPVEGVLGAQQFDFLDPLARDGAGLSLNDNLL